MLRANRSYPGIIPVRLLAEFGGDCALASGAAGVLVWGSVDNSSSPNGVAAYSRYAETVLAREIEEICGVYTCSQHPFR